MIPFLTLLVVSATLVLQVAIARSLRRQSRELDSLEANLDLLENWIETLADEGRRRGL